MPDDRFCAMCDIDLGLHGTDDPSEDGFDCEHALRKADLLYAMDRAFGGWHPSNSASGTVERATE